MSQIEFDSDSLDLTGVTVSSSTVVASPAAAAETIVASVTLPPNVRADQKVIIIGWLAYTAGTNAVTATKKIRRTDASGSTRAASGAATVVATTVYDDGIVAFDTGVAGGQVYVLTLTMGSGSAASTVSAVSLVAFVL